MIINIVEDEPKATQEEFSRRKAICASCKLFENDTCSDCGCLIDRKALVLEDTCPLGKWKL